MSKKPAVPARMPSTDAFTSKLATPEGKGPSRCQQLPSPSMVNCLTQGAARGHSTSAKHAQSSTLPSEDLKKATQGVCKGSALGGIVLVVGSWREQVLMLFSLVSATSAL